MAWQEYLSRRGGIPPAWMILSAMLEFCGAGVWIATVVCGLLALRRPQRRALAGIALAIAGLFVILFCCGSLGSLGIATQTLS